MSKAKDLGELLCCPFCGSDKIELVGGSYPHLDDRWAAACNNCLSHGPYCDSRRGAVAEWNGRSKNTTQDKVDSLVELVVDIKDCLEFINDSGTAIIDTLWYAEGETLFDYIDMRLDELDVCCLAQIKST